MFKNMINGFFMALCDSVPGVSGGTFAFIMGFYDDFIGCFHGIFKGSRQEKKHYRKFAISLLIGWIIGMACAVAVLTSLFESHIYFMSSLFVGFIAGSIPLIISEERESFKKFGKGVGFFIIGLALVVAITYMNGHFTAGGVDMATVNLPTALKLFFVGIIAISAMFLPGISGSTILIIFGMYMPILMSLRSLVRDLSYLPNILIFAAGVLVGIAVISKLIKVALKRFRPQMVYFILGMMIGSFYSIFMGPATLEPAREAMSLTTFNWIGLAVGLGIVILMQSVKSVSGRKRG